MDFKGAHYPSRIPETDRRDRIDSCQPFPHGLQALRVQLCFELPAQPGIGSGEIDDIQGRPDIQTGSPDENGPPGTAHISRNVIVNTTHSVSTIQARRFTRMSRAATRPVKPSQTAVP